MNAPSIALELRFAALSDLGRVRKENQDSGYAGPRLLMVADGVGGAAYGDVASHTAVGVMRSLDADPGDTADGAAALRLDAEEPEPDDPLAILADAVHRVHERISELVAEDPDLDGTSTTITAGLFDGHRLAMVHIGDSRGYLLRDGELRQLTKDHTLVQSLVDEGRISAEEASTHPHKNLILRAVDGIHEPEPDLFFVDVLPGDRILLCSDGCSGVLDGEALASVLGDGTVDFASVQLVSTALDLGSSDNVTVILADIVAAGDEADAESAEAAIGPMPVGAAATIPRKLRGERHRFRRRNAAAQDESELLDPEVLRYAPRPPHRLAWLRRLSIGLVVLLVLAGAGKLAYDWTQRQYFVGEDDGDVVIFRGVDLDLPLLDMHTVAERSEIRVADLDEVAQKTVTEGISTESLADARKTLSNIEQSMPSTESTSPTPTPPVTTTTPGTTPTPGTTCPTPADPATPCP